MQREGQKIELIKRLQPRLVLKNIVLMTKKRGKHPVTHKQVFGSLALNKRGQAQ